MAMNSEFQICGLCILILLLIFYKTHKNLHLYKESVFFTTLCIMTVSLVFDIGSLVAIHYKDILPMLLVKFVCKTYIITLIWGSWSALVYVVSDLVSQKEHKKSCFNLALIAACQSLVVYLMPIYIFDDGDDVYTYGPSTTMVYVFVFLYILATIFTTHRYRQQLNSRRRFALNLWMLIWIVAATIQFFNSSLLLVGFASSLGVLILFGIMENPEANLERRLGCFNSYALTEYLQELFETGKDFALLEVSFEDEKFLEEHGVDTNSIIRGILQLCGKNIMAFKNINLSLVMVSQSVKDLEATGHTILKTLSASSLFQNSALVTMVPQAGSFTDAEELFRFLAFAQANCPEEKGTLLVADESMLSRFRSQFLMEREIALALAQDRVEVFLQPIYSTESRSFTSAEALVRIRKLNGELLPPGQFIPVAESNGQIIELGERVFEKVCAFLKNTQAVRLGIRYIEINLSVVQCEKEDLADRLISIIEKYDLDPGMINLEITETASISARKILLENMKKLIAYGFSFSLDDFGKGQSNLMYVVEMPVSIIKLDYDMSKAFFRSEKARHVVQAVISMSHGMDLKVVAEGIETKEEAEEIIREGTNYIQGFYYSKPLPEMEFLKFLSNNG